ncbi:adult-specific cuticular protein ACP-20-like [Macrobrachium nipponense]|uniref:adult-specific cuticular protein ACP-20-like n=1 Tax=Macrobrachium nipponense TaxID=159736 RepID=UPI0030C7C162
MFAKVFLILAVSSIIKANPGGYGHGHGGHGHGGHGKGGKHGYGEPLPYYYGYHVSGDYKGPHFHHDEKSDGKAVHGSYTVALPDGRKQHVKYSADHYKGFVAHVSYKGKAQHPSYYGPAVVFDHHKGGYH